MLLKAVTDVKILCILLWLRIGIILDSSLSGFFFSLRGCYVSTLLRTPFGTKSILSDYFCCDYSRSHDDFVILSSVMCTVPMFLKSVSCDSDHRGKHTNNSWIFTKIS